MESKRELQYSTVVIIMIVNAWCNLLWSRIILSPFSSDDVIKVDVNDKNSAINDGNVKVGEEDTF